MSNCWDCVSVRGSCDLMYPEEGVTLGELMKKCLSHPLNNVVFVGSKCTVGGLGSWRGSYGIPAITYEDGVKTGEQVYNELLAALGQTHYGYKGGEYNYSKDDYFYVSLHGSAEEFKIVKIKQVKGELVLYTKIVPY